MSMRERKGKMASVTMILSTNPLDLRVMKG
jgi:hypothetical protein